MLTNVMLLDGVVVEPAGANPPADTENVNDDDWDTRSGYSTVSRAGVTTQWDISFPFTVEHVESVTIKQIKRPTTGSAWLQVHTEGGDFTNNLTMQNAENPITQQFDNNEQGWYGVTGITVFMTRPSVSIPGTVSHWVYEIEALAEISVPGYVDSGVRVKLTSHVMKVAAHPEDEGPIRVATPSGIMSLVVVPVESEEASPVKINTPDGVKALVEYVE